MLVIQFFSAIVGLGVTSETSKFEAKSMFGLVNRRSQETALSPYVYIWHRGQGSPLDYVMYGKNTSFAPFYLLSQTCLWLQTCKFVKVSFHEVTPDYLIRNRVFYGETEAVQRLGYAAMKPEQLQAVSVIISGRDVFSVLLTGFGKSLCFACLPTMFDLSIVDWRTINCPCCRSLADYYERSGKRLMYEWRCYFEF